MTPQFLGHGHPLEVSSGPDRQPHPNEFGDLRPGPRSHTLQFSLAIRRFETSPSRISGPRHQRPARTANLLPADPCGRPPIYAQGVNPAPTAPGAHARAYLGDMRAARRAAALPNTRAAQKIIAAAGSRPGGRGCHLNRRPSPAVGAVPRSDPRPSSSRYDPSTSKRLLRTLWEPPNVNTPKGNFGLTVLAPYTINCQRPSEKRRRNTVADRASGWRAGACLSDVADVIDATENNGWRPWMNATPAIILPSPTPPTPHQPAPARLPTSSDVVIRINAHASSPRRRCRMPSTQGC